MSEESNISQPIPLSQAQKIRRLNERNEKVNISESRLRDILNEAVYEPLVKRIERLENSMNLMANQFEGFKNGDSEDAALRVTTDSEAFDLALASVIPKEDLYPYLCQDIAEKLELRKYDVTQIIKKLQLRDNPKYHTVIVAGKTKKVQKWSEATYQRIKQALDSGEYPRPNLD